MRPILKYEVFTPNIVLNLTVQTSPIRIKINHGNSILSTFHHRLALYVGILPFTIARGETMMHACGKTVIKLGFCDLYLNYLLK